MSKGRLIIVSNRVPSEGPPAGGLVVALHECLTERGGLWIGTSGEIADEPGGLTDVPAEGYTMKTFDLTEEEHEGYYLSYANSVLWPLCHRRADLMDLQPGAFDVYMGVNRRLAKMLAEIVTPDDLIWIHDYHFMPLAQCLRQEGVTATMGYFHHIPFPTPQDLAALPEAAQFPSWIGAFDLVGLQTQGDVGTAIEVFRHALEAEMLPDGDMLYRGRTFRLRSFPIGIDAASFHEDAKLEDGRKLVNLAPGQNLIIGVDRLDYSKGLPNRLSAFGKFLENRAEGSPRATMLQIAPPTREAVAAYRDVRAQLEQIAGTVNGLHGELGWTPVKYIHRAVPREKLAALYRAARVGLVTPFCDGMNLVAKEYVAAQDPDDPGVLVLSQSAGAAEEMTDALIVNPYDVTQMAQAIGRALSMSLEDRRARYQSLRKVVFENDISRWTANYLAALSYPRT